MFDAARLRLNTVRDLLRFSVSRFNEARLFFGHGYANAFDEAAYLILHALHLPQDSLEAFLDASVLKEERDAVLNLVERRIRERLPAAYLTHEAWLADHAFYVDEQVIVPRSLIAELLKVELHPWISDRDAISLVLDLCTGSGCLAILAALAFPRAAIDATDISADALAVARRNVTDYHLDTRVRLLECDMFRGLENKRYDLILANPPYVRADSMTTLPPEYRHEPRRALDGGGADGLDAVRIILREAYGHLRERGLLIVEVGRNRQALEAAFPGLPFVWLDTSSSEAYVFLLRREELD